MLEKLLTAVKAKIPKLKFIREDGEVHLGHSTYCPKCGHHVVEKRAVPGVDFNEHGWYQVLRYACKSPECGHTWDEKAMIQEGGQSFYYGKGRPENR
jgi:hypothetical protein